MTMGPSASSATGAPFTLMVVVFSFSGDDGSVAAGRASGFLVAELE
jgi:hypothetical protein